MIITEQVHSRNPGLGELCPTLVIVFAGHVLLPLCAPSAYCLNL